MENHYLGNLPDPGIEPWSPALQADFLPSEPPGNTTGNSVPASWGEYVEN